MIGQIGPLVQGGIARWRVLGAHLLGGATGGMLAGLVLGWLGILVAAIAPLTSFFGFGRSFVLPAICVYAGLSDLGLRSLPKPGHQRQTPHHWLCAFGPVPASFAWGFDLATGVSTKLPFLAVMVIPTYALLSNNWAAAVLMMGLYGLSRAAMVDIAVLEGGEDFQSQCGLIAAHSNPLKIAAGCLALLAATAGIAGVI